MYCSEEAWSEQGTNLAQKFVGVKWLGQSIEAFASSDIMGKRPRNQQYWKLWATLLEYAGEFQTSHLRH